MIKRLTRGSDECYTPSNVFDILTPYLPKDKLLFECAVGTGLLKGYMESAGYNVVTSNDFFNDFPDYDILVTNPPFSLKDKFLEEAYKRNKPFAMLLPLTSIGGKKRHDLFKKYGVELLIPYGRTDFTGKGAPWFQVCWVCWKLLPKELIYI